MRTELNKLRAIPNTMVSTYTYSPLIGLASMTDPGGKSILYDYDEFGRLIIIKDISGQAKASYCYNYAGQLTPCANLAPTGSIAASGLTLIGITSPPLPVILTEFEAVKNEKVVDLTWSTTTETNSERFDIERSNDGKNWEKLGEVQALGESTALQQYSFTDRKPLNAENLYRLKMIDKDQSFAYGRIRSIRFDSNIDVNLFPNPVTVGEHLYLSTDNLNAISGIQFFDSAGKLVLKSGATKRINTSSLTSGLYVVKISYTDGSVSTHRIVKQ